MADRIGKIRQSANIDQRLSPNYTFNALCGLRNTEVSLRWTRAQLFIVINSAAITAVTFIVKPIFEKNADSSDRIWVYSMILAICITMSAFAFLWVLVNKRADEWVNYWTERIKKLEANYIPDNEYDLQGIFGEKYEKLHGGAHSFHSILSSMSSLFLVGWLVASLISTILLVNEVHPQKTPTCCSPTSACGCNGR